MGRYHIYIYLEKPQLQIFIPADLIWELHAELLCHLVSVKWVRCRVLLVEKVNLDKTSKWIADIFSTFPFLTSPQAQWMRGSASQERIGKEKRQYPNNIRILKH